MTLKQYARHINALAKAYPNAKVVYSIDDEGNGYSVVHYAPNMGNYIDGEFLFEEEFEDYVKNGGEPVKVNAICIN